MRKINLAKLRDEKGATAIEYGMIVAAIGASLAVLIFLFGDVVRENFEIILGYLSS